MATEDQPQEPSVLQNEGAVPAAPANPADIEGHPDLELDKDRAHYVADATKDKEMEVVAAEQATESELAQTPPGFVGDALSLDAKAIHARDEADARARRAGAEYDEQQQV